MRVQRPAPNILEANEAYWFQDHTDDYIRTKRVFIALVHEYNTHINSFTAEQKMAFSNIHRAWSSKLYHQEPWLLFENTRNDHEILDDTINNDVWQQYYREMKNYHQQDHIRKYRSYYETYVKPTGAPREYPQGPTGAV